MKADKETAKTKINMYNSIKISNVNILDYLSYSKGPLSL